MDEPPSESTLPFSVAVVAVTEAAADTVTEGRANAWKLILEVLSWVPLEFVAYAFT
jgi:hypothetical protein